jgi:hypothetical protein
LPKQTGLVGYNLPEQLTDLQIKNINNEIKNDRFIENHGETLLGLSNTLKNELIINCVGESGVEVRGRFINKLIDTNKAETISDALDVWVETTAKNVLELIATYYGLAAKNDISNRDAALECVRFWVRSYPELSGEDIATAIRGSMEARNKDGAPRFVSYQTLTVAFFVSILQWYSLTKKAVRGAVILAYNKELEAAAAAEKERQKAENNTKINDFWWNEFINEVTKRKATQTVFVAKENTLGKLKAASLIVNQAAQIKPIAKKANLELLKHLLLQRTGSFATQAERQKNSMKIAILLLAIIKNVCPLNDSEIVEIYKSYGKDLPVEAEIKGFVEKYPDLANTATSENDAALRIRVISGWYQYAVETCDLQQLISLGF